MSFPERFNVVLIGMPGSGKTTVGKRLAQEMDRPFVDTDQLIERRFGKPLQQILNEEGSHGFMEKEESVILGLKVSGHILATGGSVVYSHKAMDHLARGGVILWLDLPLSVLQERLRGTMDTRGIVRGPHQGLQDLYEERRPLYARYADLRVSVVDKSDQEVVEEIRLLLHTRPWRREEGVRWIGF